MELGSSNVPPNLPRDGDSRARIHRSSLSKSYSQIFKNNSLCKNSPPILRKHGIIFRNNTAYTKAPHQF